MAVRVLLLADTHLGFDDPQRPRVVRRRRGPDFFAAYDRALAPARAGEVDLVVHGGDVLFRSRIPVELARRAYAPLLEVAEGGVPVCVVPGNHERGRLPHGLLMHHPRIHVFDRPRTVRLELGRSIEGRGLRVALSGFPHTRGIEGQAFADSLERTDWREAEADVRLLCVHQAFAGAQVGVQDFTFRRGDDVIERGDVPATFTAVLAGHIHRAQALTGGWAPPVFYPGAIERTSFAERNEPKGYLRLDFARERLVDHRFVSLDPRPMVVIELDPRGLSEDEVAKRMRQRLGALDPDAVVRIDVAGATLPRALGNREVRALAPPSMNVTVMNKTGRPVDAPVRRARRSRSA